MHVESSDSLFSFLFFFYRLSLSTFYVIKKKITVHFTCVCTFHFIIYIYITGYIQKRVFCGRFKGHSRIISTIHECRFTRRLQNETSAQNATSLYTQSRKFFLFTRTSTALGINENLGKPTETKITSQVASFIKQILFMAYGRSSIVLTKLLLFRHGEHTQI
jgi:hypothetical protein